MSRADATAPISWTDADVVRAIESEAHRLRAAATLARAIADCFDAAANGTYPLSELPRFVRDKAQLLGKTADKIAAGAADPGPLTATSHRA